jgi:hypothetical protein
MGLLETRYSAAAKTGLWKRSSLPDLTIAQALTDFVPLSKTMADQIVELRSWEKGRARFTTSTVVENKLRKLVA